LKRRNSRVDKITNKFSLQKSVEYTLLAYAFTLPLSRAAISFFTLLLFILWLIEPERKERFIASLKNPLIFSLTLFLLFSLLSLIWSTHFMHGVKYIRHYWYLLPLLTFFSYAKSELIPKIISAFLFGMLMSEILSYGIFFELWSFGHATPQDPSPIMNHIHYSAFLAVTSLLLFNKVFFETDLRWKFFYFLYFLMTSSNLFINGGRTGQLAYVVGMFVVAIINVKHKILGVFTIFVLASAIFITAFSLSPTFQTRLQTTLQSLTKIESATNQMYASSFGTRLGAWMVATKIFQDHPLLGVGMGSEMQALKDKIDTTMPQLKTFDPEYGPLLYNIKHYHNSYVTYLVQMGIIGLALFLYIFYSLAKLPVQNKELNNLKYIFITVFMIAALFEQMFALEFPLALFTLFSGIFIAANSRKSVAIS